MDLRMVHFRVWISRSEVWETSRCLEITCFGPLLDPFWTPFGRSWRVLGAIKAIGTPRRACWELKGLSGCITALPQVTSLRLEYYLQYRTQRV